MVTPVQRAILGGFTDEERQRGRDTAARNRARARELLAAESLAQQQSAQHPPTLAELRASLLRDLAQLQQRCRQSLAGPTLSVTEHRALAATLIALSQRVDEAIAGEQASGVASESYEQRLARAYTSQGLPVPGRLARAAGVRAGGSARDQQLQGEYSSPMPDTPPQHPSGGAGQGESDPLSRREAENEEPYEKEDEPND